MRRLLCLGGALAVLSVWVAPLLGGTADRPYTLLVAAAAAFSCLLVLLPGPQSGRKQHGEKEPVGCAPADRRLYASWFHVFLAVALVGTLLQAVPLPPALRALLAAGSDADLRQLTAGLVADGRNHPWPLSLDLGATLHEAARLGGYLCLLIVFTQRLQGQGLKGRRQLRQAVCGAAGLCAALGLFAGLISPLPAPIGVPAGGATRALFPAGFYNSNHLAALMGLGALLAVGQAFSTTNTRIRLGLLGLCVLCNVVLLSTFSRAGITVWLAAQALLLLRQRRSLAWPLLAAVLGLLVAVLSLEAVFAGLRHRFLSTSLSTLTAPGSKVYAWGEAMGLLRGHFALGVGRGAFENAFQHIQLLSGRLRFVYLENEWLQTVIDWGIPLSLCLFGLLFLALRDGFLVWRDSESGSVPRRSGAAVALLALAALGLHNLFDFNLEVGGVAVCALALCALCQRLRFVLPRGLGIGLGVLTLALALFVALYFPSHDEDGARLRALCEQPQSSLSAIIADGRAAVLRHPFDAYLPALVAARLQAEPRTAAGAADREELLTWLNRALLANPHDVLARYTGAALLIETGHRAQGLLLLRGAIADADDEERRRLLRSLVAWTDDVGEVRAALPDSAATAALLEILGTAKPPRWPLLKEVARRALAEADTDSAAMWLGRAALGMRDADAALLAARALVLPARTKEVPALLFADLVDLLGDSGRGEAEPLMQQALLRGERPELLLSLGRLKERRGLHDEARPFFDRALQLSQEPALTARIHEVYGDLEAGAGNPHQATAHRLEAARLRSP